MLASALLLPCAVANAGSVQVGLLNSAEFGKWECSGAVSSLSRTKSRCENAKFNQTSACDTGVVSNDSKEAVRVELQLSGSGFEERPNHVGGVWFYVVAGPQCTPRTVDDDCSKVLAPGHSCYQDIEFWPRDSG